MSAPVGCLFPQSVILKGSGTTDRRYFHADERGSIVAVTNNSGLALETRAYSPYGEPESFEGSRFQYTGQIAISEVGLYYYKARFYAPSLGRFLQTDPLGYVDGLNLYAYVQGDPINFTDPTGLFADDCGSAVITTSGCVTTFTPPPSPFSLSFFDFGDLFSFGGAFGGSDGPFNGGLDFGFEPDLGFIDEILDVVEFVDERTCFVAEGEFSVGAQAEARLRGGIFEVGGGIDALSVRFRGSTIDSGVFITQGVNITGQAGFPEIGFGVGNNFNFGREGAGAIRRTGGQSRFQDQPAEITTDNFIGIGFSGAFLLGLDIKLGVNVVEAGNSCD